MIYLDNAATSLQKPPEVAGAVYRAIRTNASPGRGCHSPATLAADTVFKCRMALDYYFNVNDPEKVVFTSNATHALNVAINSLVRPGDNVVISGYEHNAVLRPLRAKAANLRIAASPLFDGAAAIRAFKRELGGAKCAVYTHVSNVFGYILPIEEIASLCRRQGVPLIIDASQSAGTIPLDFSALDAAFIAMPGHKGLLGPQGTGVLLCRTPGEPIIFGGTGGNSTLPLMPEFLPDRLEAGTHNVPGIAGLERGVNYLCGVSRSAILEHERKLLRLFVNEISGIPDLRIFAAPDINQQSGVISVISDKVSCEALAEQLGRSGICVRAGLHCAPLAHKTAGTTDTGTVRFSFSPFNTTQEIIKTTQVLKKILHHV